MKNPLTLILILLITSCTDRGSSTKTAAGDDKVNSSAMGKKDIYPTTFDSTLTPFTDTSFKLKFRVFNTESYDEEKYNSTVSFSRNQSDKFERIFEDSFYCMHPMVKRVDFDNDKIKDFLFFYSTGARANPTYHLYLVDTVNHNLKYVKGFENLPNPDLDTTNNIITSIALSGTNYYTFYRINSVKKLINLGHSIETDLGDTAKYDKAIKQIHNQWR
jgi:hypothetical protein